jgi:hypothetical protein
MALTIKTPVCMHCIDATVNAGLLVKYGFWHTLYICLHMTMGNTCEISPITEDCSSIVPF